MATVTKVPLIHDHDGNYDDLLAMMYVAKHPLFDLKASTLSTTGLATPHGGPPNTLAVADLLGIPSLPVSYGHPHSLSPVATFPLEWRVGLDSFFDRMLITPVTHTHNHTNRLLDGTNILEESTVGPSHLSSPELIVQIIRDSEVPVVILCTGPMTNIAVALSLDRSITSRISAIFAMGSAYGADHNSITTSQLQYNGLTGACTEQGSNVVVPDAKPLNLTGTMAAVRLGCRGVDMTKSALTEWNLFQDVLAWHKVMQTLNESGVRAYVFTNNVTREMPVDAAQIREYAAALSSTPRLQRFVEELGDEFAGTDGAYWWDAVAAVVMSEVIAGHGDSGVCTNWLERRRTRVSLPWRGADGSQNPYGRILDSQDVGYLADYCTLGSSSAMWETYWPAVAGESFPSGTLVADGAYYLRTLAPAGRSTEDTSPSTVAWAALVVALLALFTSLLVLAIVVVRAPKTPAESALLSGSDANTPGRNSFEVS